MAKYAKNVSGAAKSWVGQEIANNAYYLIDPSEASRWAYNSLVIADIGSGDLIIAKSNSGSDDISDVATAIDWLRDEAYPKDTDGAPLTRTKITQTGWHYQCHSIEFTTSKLNSGYNKDSSGAGLGFLTVKYFDSNGTELTAGTQAELDSSCVMTRIDWEPTYDIEVIGGVLYQPTAPSSDVRLWVTAIPDLTVAQGGSVPFCQGGLNLKYMGTGEIYDIDGKTPKLLPYSATYHTNKFRIICRHDAGVQTAAMLVFKVFRQNV